MRLIMWTMIRILERCTAAVVGSRSRAWQHHTDTALAVVAVVSDGHSSMVSPVGLVKSTHQLQMIVMGKKIKQPLVEVPDIDWMEDEDFIKHLEKRHAAECKIEGYLSRHSIPTWLPLYRAFHERLHTIAVPGQHDHEHVIPDEDEE